MGEYTPTSDGAPSDETLSATFAANKVVGEILPQGADRPFQRLVDTVTGAGLFTTNADPNVVGVDPLTGDDAPIGTDVGFSASARGYLRRGIWNGDLSTPPPDTGAPIGDDNVLPYWSLEQVSGTAVSATWEAGAVTLSLAAGAAGDDGAFEQLFPIDRSGYQRFAYIIAAYISASVTATATGYVEGQFLAEDLTTIGSAVRTEADTGDVEVIMGATPTTAFYLRVRFGIERDALADSGTASRTFTEVNVFGVPDRLYVSNLSTGPAVIQGSSAGGYFQMYPEAGDGRRIELEAEPDALSPVRVKNTSGTVIGAVPIGLAPYAYPIGMPHNASSVNSANLDTVSAGLGGARAIPILVPSLMLVESLSIWSTDTANARAAEWALYWDGGEATSSTFIGYDAFISGVLGTFSFTPGAASVRTSTATGAPLRLAPGVWWLVIRNTSTARTFGIGYIQGGSIAGAGARSKTNQAALSVSIDISGWTNTQNMPLVRLNGRIGAESAAFL